MTEKTKIITNKSPHDVQLADFKCILNIFGKVNKLIEDTEWVESTLADLSMFQPVLWDVLMSYDRKVPPGQLTEVFVLYLSVWTYFKDEPGVKVSQVSIKQYDRAYRRNARMFAKNDPGASNKISVLFGVILERFGEEPELMAMEAQTKAGLMLSVKSIIDCFNYK